MMMKHPINNKKKKKNNSIVTAATIFTLTIFLIVVASTSPVVYGQVRDNSFTGSEDSTAVERKLAPSVVSGDNIYIAWWTNNKENGNEEVMFRASNDGDQTFGDKINLSNSPDTQSQTAEILAVGNNIVYVTWWELNKNVHPHTNESVLRESTDAGETFGPVINLGTNGTITTTATGNTT